ncbi:MAG: carbohydrate-binding protein [Methanospirillum sp.]
MRPTHVLLFLLLVLLVAAPAAAQTTQVQVIRYASDGTTVADQETVDVAWMESNLPVFGDGATPYLFQGPLTEITDYTNTAKWNPAEDNNVGKVNETIRGTYLTDLCNLVGGMQPGGEVKVVASDGFARTFAYDNVYSPQPRQGPMVLAWWTAREGYGFQDGIRLFFGADNSTNPWGLHVFGNQDMKETFDEKYWGWYGGKDALPSAAQLSNKWLAKIEIFPAPSTDWTILLTGSIRRDITKSYFESGLSWSGHRATYTDASGGVWEGMPLWRLVGYVDDENEHSGASYNNTLAELGYTIRVIAADGFSKTFTSQEIAESSNYIVANTLNGSALPDQINGKNVWPLKLVGTNATGGKSVGNITEIRLEGVPITVPTPTVTATATPTPQPTWSLSLKGYSDYMVTSQFWNEALACGGHTSTYSDGVGSWEGLPLWRLVGLVDDQLGHEVYIGAYNDTLADQGYTVRVIAGDGYNKTFTSQEVKRSANYLLASKLNGSALPELINGKNVWPLKLVGANATGGKSIGNVVEIRLEGLPIAPVTTTATATPTPTPTTGPAALFDGDLTLKDGTFPCTAYNSGSTYQVQNLTPNGVLELASKASGFGYNVTDKKWVTMGTMLLDGAGGYSLDSGTNRAWTYRVNNVTKNDFSSTEGISVYRVADGDLVEFYYGTKGGAIENAEAVIRARVHVRQQTTVFDGDVTLINGTFGAYAYNSGATIPVNNLTVHGALQAAAAKGGFTYRATDKKWSTMSTFLLDGVSTFDFNKTENTAWAYTLNGAVMNDYSADQGISAQSVKNGDQLVFYFGVKGAALDDATAVVRVRVFVANDADFALALKGAQNAMVSKSALDASTDRVNYTDISGTWSGVPLWTLVGQVDDTDASSFNDALATRNYTVKVSAVDGYNKSLYSGQIARSGDFLIADRLNGAPLPTTMWPLRLVGASVPPSLSVAKIATVELVGLPEEPSVGGDIGYFLVSTVPSGAEIYLEDIGQTRYHVGNTSAGPLNASIYLTATPVRKIIANLTGYRDAVFNITQYPAPDGTIPVDLTLEPLGNVTPTPTVTPTPETPGPYNGAHVPSTRIEAEYFDTGGEGVAYHDLEPQNLGGNTMRAGEGVDVETEAGVTDVGFIRAGEYLRYSIDSTIAGNYTLTLHAANPDATAKAVTVSVDGVPAGQVSIGGTGSWTTYRDFASAAPLTIPAGRHVVTLAFEGVTRLNLDWLGLAAGTVVTPTPTPTFQTVPYGPGNAVPGRVQAENFDTSGTAAAYSDTTLANEGGAYRPSEPVDIEYTAGIASYNVGWIRTGEWLVYTVNVATDGMYTASFNAANPDAASKPVDVYVDGAKVGTVQIGGTGSFGTFRTFAYTIALPAGAHQIKLAFPSTRLNLDYVEFAPGAGTTQPTVTTSPSGAASFTAAPLSASKGTAVKFTLTPKTGKTVRSAWWSFDATNHLNTWNSRDTSPTFFYPAKGTYTPLVKITYTDGSTETVERANYVTAR